MASKLLHINPLSSVSTCVRHFSARNPFGHSKAAPRVVHIVGQSAQPRPDPADFPLPGCVTSSFKLELDKTKVKTVSCLDQKGILDGCLWRDHQVNTLVSFGEACRKMEVPESLSIKTAECNAHKCPSVAKKEFKELFPHMDGGESPLTVLTVTLPTQNDMSAWSETMESERDHLTKQFIETANCVCVDLKKAGYWADFIDPCSGRPYLGPFTNATLFETDERLTRFGVHVEDLGCCKVVSHREWGTHSFVAALFTNAPSESELVQNVVKRLNRNSS